MSLRRAFGGMLALIAIITYGCTTPTPTPSPTPSPTQPTPTPSPSTLAPCAESCSCSVLVSWTASTTPTVTGYYINWGTTSGGPYPYQVNAFDNTHVDIGNFCKGDYYFVATAYTPDAESVYSNEANADVTDMTGMAARQMKVHVGGEIPTPRVQQGLQQCDSQGGPLSEIQRLTDPANRAAQALLSQPEVHATVRITGVSLGDGVPSDGALAVAQQLCNGQRSCEIHIGEIPDPAPSVHWSATVQWVCDHTPFHTVNHLTISKDSPGTIQLRCGYD